MLHILFISTGYPNAYHPLDGIFFRDQAEALAAYGHQVDFIAINPVSVKHIITKKNINYLVYRHFIEKKVDTRHYAYINLPQSPLYIIKQTLRKGKKVANEYSKESKVPDIIHMHCFEAVELAEYFINEYNIPLVVTEHSSRFLNNTLHPSLEKYALKAFSLSSMNIAVSHVMAKELSKKYNVAFKYLPNVVDTDFFTPTGRTCDTPFTFLNVAALTPIKSQNLLITAFAEVLRSHHELQLIIVGEGPERKRLEKQITKFGIEKNVTLTGFLDRNSVKKYMQSADAFVLSSSYETFGVVLIEAMSCGLPVISTKCSGPESIITNERLGKLCNISSHSLAMAMEEVYNNGTGYDKAFIRKYATDNFSNFAVSQKLTTLYQNLLGK